MISTVIFDFWGVIYDPSTGKLIPGVAEYIDELDSQQLHYGIASSSAQAYIKEFLHETELAGRFNVIVGMNEVTRQKPHPECYHTVAQAFSALPQECLVIDDSLAPIEGAKAAGFYTVLFGIEVQSFDDPLLRTVLS